MATAGVIDFDRVRKNWGWFAVLGGVLIAFGVAALANPLPVGKATMVFIGVILVASGVSQILVAIQNRGWSGVLLTFLAGILEIVVGVVVLKRPGEAMLVMSLLFTIYLLVGGIFRVIAALSLRVPGCGWLALSGAISALLGVLLLSEWPEPASWLIGTCVGVDLVAQGASWLALALGLRKAPPA